MNNINKALIAPIVAVVFMMLKATSGFQIDDATLDVVVNAVLSIIAIIGVFANPTKNDEPKE
ncbi:hypothetical protein UFOVP103_14 [uncultured Caudovirales phage]|uniref:Holin n=1 Tax=uncultured Caudovirales phage TaxID=2100421 RepID=A0A6J7WHT0_9CAUD|nr:hypothetical protein UFOVP103_14 [uncultured Caudovirales phage]CAB5217031.1 hypothetical protein UFOVP197_41 [uncultured Caudovirales phage]